MRIENQVLVQELASQSAAAISAADIPLFVNGLTVAYDRRPVLWNIDYTAPTNRLIAIIGPNGAGKSTFLKSLIGLVPKISGRVRVFGIEGKRQQSRIAYVPQRTSVDWDFPTSALDVVTMGLYGRIGWFRPVRWRHRNEAMEALDRVGLADFAHRQIGQLSGGQQQRVFIARALAQDADLYLMDEPLAGVDAATETRIIDILRALRDEGRTVLAVHHDLSTVQNYFDEVLVLNGRLVAAGPTAEAFTDAVLADAYGGRLASNVLATAGTS